MKVKSDHSSRRWVWYFAITIMIVTSIPYFIGFLSQGEAWRFTGFVFGVEDGNSYIAKMLRGTAGEWLFRSPYSAVQQTGVIAYLPYILLGKLAVFPGASHNQLVAIFHLFRILAGVAMIISTYDFLSIYIQKERWRRGAVAIITLGGGLGWVLVLFGEVKWLGSLPLDLTSPESFGFLAIYGLPHLAMARALLLWGLRAFLVGERILAPGVFWFFLSFFQPLDVVIAWIVIGVYFLLSSVNALWKRENRKLVDWLMLQRNAIWIFVSVLISSPLVIYTFIRFRGDDYLNNWTAQNQITSPHLAHYLLAYILMALFVIFGVKSIRKEFPDLGWMLIGWVGILPILVYSPTVIQRRLAEGVWVALVILAVNPFARDDPLLSYRWTYLWIFTFPTTLLLLAGGIQTAIHPGLPAFRPSAEVRSFLVLNQDAPKNSVVLSSHETGNGLPAWAPVHVVIGHGPETVNYELVKDDVDKFYDEKTSPVKRKALITDYEIDYIYWGPAEQRLGKWNPESADYVYPFSKENHYRIYKVRLAITE